MSPTTALSKLLHENQELRRELAKNQLVHETLLAIFDAVTTSEDLPDLFRTIHSELGKIFDVENFYIALYDEASDSVDFPYFADELDDEFGHTPNISQSPSLTAEVIRQKRPLSFTRDSFLTKATDPRHSIFMGPAPEIWLGAPLRIAERVIGVMAVQNYRDPNAFSARDLEILDSVSFQVAIAIERKSTLDALSKKDRQFRELIQNIPSVVFTVNSKGATEFISPAFERFTGRNLADFLGAPWHENIDHSTYPDLAEWVCDRQTGFAGQSLGTLVHPDDRDELLATVNTALATMTPYTAEYRILLDKDRPYFVTEKGQFLLHKDGYRLEAMIHDTHDRRFAEEINQVLFEISNAVNTVTSLDQLYRSIHQSLGRVVDTTNFYIALYDQERDLIEFPYHCDHDPVQIEQIPEASKSRGYTAEVIFSQEPILASREEIAARDAAFNTSGQLGTPSQVWLGVPLKVHNHVIGALVCQSYTDPDRYGHKDIRILTSVSDQVAIAIERRRAYERLQRSEEQVRTLSRQTEQLSLAAASLLDKNELLDILNSFCASIVEHSDFARVIISLFKPDHPFRDIVASGGFEISALNKLARFPSPPERFLNFFNAGIKLGRLSYYLPHTAAGVFEPEGFLPGERNSGHDENGWHPEDNLFVRMNDSSGTMIGVISVDSSKSGRKPSEETVRPLEIFSSLISQIILHKRAQDDLALAKAQAEKATMAKSQFLANMSHEIRTPLNAIIGLTDMALDTNPTPTQGRALSKIKTAGQTLLAIINDILDFSKIEAGKLVLEQTDFSICPLMHELFEILTPQAATKQLELIYHPSPNLPQRIHGDPLRLRQILINLLSNAIKFTDRGNVIVRVDMIASPSGHSIVFEVQDTGIGVAEDVLPTLFESFAQADGSTTRRYGGTGLGLTICKQLVALMGGEIRVSSQPGHGSTFAFTLPGQGSPVETIPTVPGNQALIIDDNAATRFALSSMLLAQGYESHQASTADQALILFARLKASFDLVLVKDTIWPDVKDALLPEEAKTIVLASPSTPAQSAVHEGQVLIKPVCPEHLRAALAFLRQPDDAFVQPPAAPAVAAHPLASRTVLVVEDNLINQEVAFHILTKAGAKVHVTADGQEALDLLRSEPVDVILMDIQMPRMDGYTATHEIRTTLGLQLPIIAMTAHALQSDRDQCLASGMNDFVSKPIDATTLVDTISRHLSGDRFISSEPQDVPAGRECLNRKSALERLDQDAQTYDNLLQLFQQRHGDIADIDRLLVRGKFEQAARLLHSLRGAAAVIGATNLVQACTQIEKSITEQNPDDIARDFDSFRTAHRELMQTLDEQTCHAAPPTCQEGILDPDQLQPDLTKLKVYLRTNNLKADGLIEKIQDYLHCTPLREWANRLRSCSDNLNYVSALEMINQLEHDNPALRSTHLGVSPEQSDRPDR